jgi:hypothetical protein
MGKHDLHLSKAAQTAQLVSAGEYEQASAPIPFHARKVKNIGKRRRGKFPVKSRSGVGEYSIGQFFDDPTSLSYFNARYCDESRGQSGGPLNGKLGDTIDFVSRNDRSLPRWRLSRPLVWAAFKPIWAASVVSDGVFK